jgi:hypothetical protein
VLDKGRGQIRNDQERMRLASRLANEWAKGAGVDDRWNLSSASPLPSSAVKFVRGGVDMKFNPGSARDDENLVLAKIVEKSGGSGYEFKVTFNPAAKGLPPIKADRMRTRPAPDSGPTSHGRRI